MPGNDKSTFDLDDIMQEARSGPMQDYGGADPKTGAGMEQYAQRQASQPEGVLGRPAMPGTSSRYAGPQSKALSDKVRASRDQPMEYAKKAAVMAPMMAIPGPGEGTLLAQIAKGAAIGGAAGGVERGALQAFRGELPDWSTLKAAGTGAAVGGVLGPVSHIPGIANIARKIPYLSKLMPPAEEAIEAAAPEEASLATKVMRGGTSSAGPEATGASAASSPDATMQVGRQSSTPGPSTSSRGAGATVSPKGSSPVNPTEEAYKAAGLHTPYSSAQETGMWHAGQGAVPSPYEEELKTLLQKLKMGGGQ